jgi:hypothetical protein
MNMTLGVKPNDTGAGYQLQIRKVVLEVQEAFPATSDVGITTDERTLKQVNAGLIRVRLPATTRRADVDSNWEGHMTDN